MSETNLEQRVSKLEQMMDSLLHNGALPMGKKDWRRTVGMFDGDPLINEIIEEGQLVREEDRRKTGA